MKLLNLLLTFAIALSSAACATKMDLKRSENKVTKDGVSVSADWIKDKKKKYFVRLNIDNESEKQVVIKLKKAQCFRGNTIGDLKRAFFNAGVKTFRFAPHQKKTFNAVCELGEEATGEYRMKVPFIIGSDDSDDDSEDEGHKHRRKLSEVEWKHGEAVDES